MKNKKTYKLDPTSDRYRECLNCKEPFMAAHRNSVHCCDKCADEFSNKKKKQEMTKKEIITNNTEKTELIPPLITYAVDTSPPEELILINLKLLKSLVIDDKKGSVFHLEYLYGLGLKLEFNQGSGVLYNIDHKLNCHFLQIGYYRIYRIEFSLVLIIKTI